MKEMDWQMLLFVGASLVHDYWIYWGLPRIYYWGMKKRYYNRINVDDDSDNKIA